MSKPALRSRACPRDHTPLVSERVSVRGPDVTVDKCPKCEGVYLDKNELLRITGDARLNRHLRDEVGFDSDSTLVCPSCGGIMDMEEVGAVEVEVCLTCFGLWLDKGELDALREMRSLEVTDAKREELVDAADAKRRMRLESERRQGGGVGGAVRRRFLWLDGALEEVVRRYL